MAFELRESCYRQAESSIYLIPDEKNIDPATISGKQLGWTGSKLAPDAFSDIIILNLRMLSVPEPSEELTSAIRSENDT